MLHEASDAGVRPLSSGASFLYAFLTRSDFLSNGAFTQRYCSVRQSNLRSLAMLDLLYIVLGLAVFAAFAFGIRSAERL